jgi:hypothetical protein
MTSPHPQAEIITIVSLPFDENTYLLRRPNDHAPVVYRDRKQLV